MKSLILASLLVAFGSTCLSGVQFPCQGAMAEELCPTGTLSNKLEIKLDDDSGPTHTISNQCVTPEETDIVINATMPLGSTSSPATTVTIGPNVNLGRRSTVAIYGVDSTFRDNRAPFTITIRDNQFGNDAIVFLDGSFPAGSAVNIFGNRFNASTPLFDRMPYPFNSVSTWAACIAINEIHLVDSTIAITSNDIYGTDVYGNANIMGVSSTGNLFFMGDGANFTVARNNITSVCNPVALGGVCSYGVRVPSVYAYTKGCYNVDENNFYVAGGMANFMPDFTNPVGSANFSFSRNKGIVNTMYIYYDIPLAQSFTVFNSLNMQSNSAINVVGNNFEVTGRGGMMVFVGDCMLNDNATLLLADNVVTSTECDPGIYFTDFSLSASTQVTINTNSFLRDDDTPLTRPMVYVSGSFGVKDKSKLIIASNTFSGREAGSAMLVDLSNTAASNTYQLGSGATLAMCSNVVDGTLLSTTNLVKTKINAVMHPRVLAGGCGAPAITVTTARTTTVATIATPTNVTTTMVSTTTRPNNGTFTENGAGGVMAVSSWTAFVAMIAATMVGLLFSA